MHFRLFIFLHVTALGRVLSIDLDDLLHAEVVDSILHHTVEVDDLAAHLAQVVLFGVADCLCDQRLIRAIVCKDVVTEDATSCSQLLDNLRLVTAGQNGDSWAVLGDVARQVTVLSVANDQVNRQILG